MDSINPTLLTLKDLREAFIKGDASNRHAEALAMAHAALMADFNRKFYDLSLGKKA